MSDYNIVKSNYMYETLYDLIMNSPPYIDCNRCKNNAVQFLIIHYEKSYTDFPFSKNLAFCRKHAWSINSRKNPRIEEITKEEYIISDIMES
jgi:hypothetical protein